MQPAKLWRSLKKFQVQCRLCKHFCTLNPGDFGYCGVRQNREGVLVTYVADRVAAANLDPIEKKPLYHFLPGTFAYSVGTVGCNFSCAFCQNYLLADSPRSSGRILGEPTAPQAIVNAALRAGAASIAYTYNEPTVFFELLLPTAKLAIQNGLQNILVSNGFQSPECLELLRPFIHAVNIDLKAISPKFYEKLCGAKLSPVLDNCIAMQKMGWWLEVTTLLIPGQNDSDAELKNLAAFIANSLGVEVPWHISRFHPAFRMHLTAVTSLECLERAWDIGQQAGLRHIYLGNVHGHVSEDTCCPSCGEPIIKRLGYQPQVPDMVRCKCCGYVPAGVWAV